MERARRGGMCEGILSSPSSFGDTAVQLLGLFCLLSQGLKGGGRINKSTQFKLPHQSPRTFLVFQS